jgi:hypothetical protein
VGGRAAARVGARSHAAARGRGPPAMDVVGRRATPPGGRGLCAGGRRATPPGGRGAAPPGVGGRAHGIGKGREGERRGEGSSPWDPTIGDNHPPDHT